MLKKIALLLVLCPILAVTAFAFTVDEYPGIVIHHDGEDAKTLAGIDALIQRQQARTQDWFGMAIPKRSLYVYGSQKEMQRQKHPVAMLFVSPDWYIGDNIGERALIVSPNTPVKGHSYDSIIGAIPHEYVHTVVYAINPKCPLWLNEGIALYLSNGHPVSVRERTIPPAGIFTSRNSLYFAKHNGYDYADKFIEFVEKTYGREKTIDLIREGDYGKLSGKTVDKLYEEWVVFLRAEYP